MSKMWGESPMEDYVTTDKEVHDNVNSPSHYKQNGKETIDTIKDSMSNEQFSGYLVGNILKYIARFKFKNGVEDLKKARWYSDKLISENE